MRAPCESCPPHCGQCAWDHSRAKPVTTPVTLVAIRTEAQYGCLQRAAVVVDAATQRPFMKVGDILHPLSEKFGGVITGTILERDIAAALAAA